MAILTILLAVYAPYSGHAAQTSSDGSWELGISVLDADLSPDDQFVAVTRESPQNPKHGVSADEWLELWDFRNHQQIAKAHVAAYTAGQWARTGPVRFTSDGKFVVAAWVTAIVVFDAGTLNLVRTIQLAGPGAFDIRRFEISPVSHTAVVASRQGGELFAVDLDSGHALFTGHAKTSIPSEITSISWKPDGSQFAVAVPAPCTNEGEVQVFGGNPFGQLKALHSKNVAAVAFSADRLYAVPASYCKGSVFNRHLGMQVFNAKTWKRERTIHLPDKDLHDSLSYAEGRLLADSGHVQSWFDALDVTTYSMAANVQLSLWGDAHSIIYTSSSLPAHSPEGRLRLSRTGKMALTVVDSKARLIRLP